MAAKEQPKQDVSDIPTIAACSALIAARRKSLSWGFLAPALLCHPRLHNVPGLEDDAASFGNHDRFAGAWIATLARFPPLHLEHAEVAKFDAAFLGQCVHDGVECLLDDVFDLELCQVNFLGNRPGEVFLGHELIPLV